MITFFRKAVVICMITTFLAACSTPPNKISATYVSPMQYRDYSCDQVRTEMQRVNNKLRVACGVQQKEAEGDAVALGVGLVLFWPALFFMMGEDKQEEISNLKGQYEALEISANEKKCTDLINEIQAAKNKQQETESEEQKIDSEAGN